MPEKLLEISGLHAGVEDKEILKGLNLSVNKGEVHVILGPNGSGKSTLMKILSGMYKATEGTMLYKGAEKEFSGPVESIRQGIAMIHQELSPVPHRSVMENIWLGREPMISMTPLVDHKKMYDDSKKLLDDLELTIDPREQMAKLTVAKMQMVEIAKAVSYNSEVVIMDEPTAALTDEPRDTVFAVRW